MPARDTLNVHLRQLAKLRPRLLAAILLVLPSDKDKNEVPGYRNVSIAAADLPWKLERLPVHNNTLGSYGMFLHAFAATRGRYDYYLFCEDDYVPSSPNFDAALLRMHMRTFPGGRNGVLAGVLQGQPAEPDSPLALHLETSHIMSSKSLQHLFYHVYVKHGWNGSTSEWMLHLLRARQQKRHRIGYYGGAIQAGFGLMLANASIEMRDWSRIYRSPYWNHRNVVDWSGAASNFSLPSKPLLLPLDSSLGTTGCSLARPSRPLTATRVPRLCSGSSVVRPGPAHLQQKWDPPHEELLRPDPSCVQGSNTRVSDAVRHSC